MLTRLSEATRTTSGGKAATLSLLLSHGLAVPHGFVVPSDVRPGRSGDRHALHQAVAAALAQLGDPVVAVRSSALGEDSAEASAAGQYESVIGVHGAEAVCQAIAECRHSARTDRVSRYWARTGGRSPRDSDMAVLVQPVIEAEASGVMFTPHHSGGPIRIESAWGLGLGVVGGAIMPDAYEVAEDGTIDRRVGSKRLRIDLDHVHGGVMTSAVSADKQSSLTLDNDTVAVVAELGRQIAEVCGGPQDIEWAVVGDAVWILQARPITAALPVSPVLDPSVGIDVLRGTPGSHGTVTAAARIVSGPADFAALRRGEIVVCATTDPAWTPLFAVAAGVVTEIGGVLSPAAIVAREYGIPAVLGVDGAVTEIKDGAEIRLNGTAGTITRL